MRNPESAFLYPSSNIKLREAHIFCFLFTEKGSSSTLNFIKVNTLKKWESFYRTSGTSASQVEFFFRESRNQIALKNLLIDSHRGFDSGDCSVCLERLKKRKITLKQCEAAV